MAYGPGYSDADRESRPDEILEALALSEFIPPAAIAAYMDSQWIPLSRSNASEILEYVEDAYRGEFQYRHEIDEYLAESWWEVAEVPDHLRPYIDNDAVVHDLHMDHNVCETSLAPGYFLFRSM